MNHRLPRGLVIVTPPTGRPISAADLRTQLNLPPGSATNEDLETFIDSAVDFIQAETGVQMLTAACRLTLDAFPDHADPYLAQLIRLPLPPLQTVQAVQYRDADGDTQTLDTEVYTVDAGSRPGRLVRNARRSWPATDGTAGCITIDFTAGYGAAGDALPKSLRLACLQLAAFYARFRGDDEDSTQPTDLPQAVKSVIARHRVIEAV